MIVEGNRKDSTYGGTGGEKLDAQSGAAASLSLVVRKSVGPAEIALQNGGLEIGGCMDQLRVRRSAPAAFAKERKEAKGMRVGQGSFRYVLN